MTLIKQAKFLYRLKNSDDRDCCAYIKLRGFVCDHYFSGLGICGSCYSGGTFADYDNIETILTREEYTQLVEFDKTIRNLGYGITKGDDRYYKGLELYKSIQPIVDKLNSMGNREFFEEIQEGEIEYLMNEYTLSREDVLEIFDNYGLEYRDRSIVTSIFSDYYELGEEEAFSLCLFSNSSNNDNWVNQIVQKHFDFESFGEEISEDDYHYELPDGRIVAYAY